MHSGFVAKIFSPKKIPMKNLINWTLGLLLGATVASAQSDAFTPPLVGSLVESYVGMQQGLASDDLEAAKTGARGFLLTLEGAPHGGGSHAIVIALTAPARAIAEATDIKDARVAFRDLSREVTSLVERIGTTGETKLFVARCPMAFNNEGGSWLQTDRVIANPYYGSRMLRCGRILKQVAGDGAGD